jgi:curved DNA-binding protein CbpA
MKRFASFLIEAKMTFEDAVRILELKSGFSIDDVKKAKKDLNIKHHPDKPGGSLTKVQDVNAAADFLLDPKHASRIKGSSSEGTRIDKAWWDARNKRAETMGRVARETFDEVWDASIFTQHFQRVFGEPFTFTGGFEQKRYQSTSSDWESYTATWRNAENTIVLEVRIGIDFRELVNKEFILSNPETLLNMSFMSDILYNRKKVKVTQANYLMSQAKKMLTDPEQLFPGKKLQVQSKKSTTRKFSRRDAYLVFQQELHATGHDDWVYVPMADDYSVALNRHTIMGTAAWAINGVYKKHGRQAMVKTQFFPETEEGMKPLFDALKALQKAKANDVDTIVDALNKVVAPKDDRPLKRFR